MGEYKIFDSRYDLIPEEEIANLVKDLDHDFHYPIKKRPDFISYLTLARNFLAKGFILFCKKENTLVAITVVYADPKNFKYAYIPYTGIRKPHRGKGIIQSLFDKRKKICKEIGMKGLMSSCSINNVKMISVLEAAGYKRIINEDEIKKLKEWNPKDNWEKAFFVLTFSE